MSVDISIGDIIAGLMLLLIAYATWLTHKYRQSKKELLNVQKNLNELILEKEEREAAQAKHADLGANFVSLGNRKHRLKIFNKGPATAYHVNIDFPDGNDVIPDNEIKEKFPLETMEPGQSVELIAGVTSGTKRKFKVRLSWQDEDESKHDKVVHVTI